MEIKFKSWLFDNAISVKVVISNSSREKKSVVYAFDIVVLNIIINSKGLQMFHISRSEIEIPHTRQVA